MTKKPKKTKDKPTEEIKRKTFCIAALFTVHHESADRAEEKLQQALNTFKQCHSFILDYQLSEAVPERQPPANILQFKQWIETKAVHHLDGDPLNENPENLAIVDMNENTPPKKRKKK